MDTISHTCFSYLVCRSTGVAQSPKIGLVAAAVATLPDLDFLLKPILPEITRFAFHRGPSHSLFMALVMGLILGGLIYRWLGLSWLRASLIVGLAWFSHLFLDMCTGFGVALWWPLTHARSSADLLFVVDLFASLPLILATLWDVGSNWNEHHPHPGIAITGLLFWTAYASISFAFRSDIKQDFLSKLNEEGYQVQTIHSEPTPFNNQLWYLCAKTDNGFVITYRSIWDGTNWERFIELPRKQSALSTFAVGHPLTEKIEVVLEDWFTSQVTSSGRLDVVDLRLGKRYGWEDDNAPFLFIYHLWKSDSGGLFWTMNKPENKYDFGRLEALFTRVTGEIPPHRLQPNPDLQ